MAEWAKGGDMTILKTAEEICSFIRDKVPNKFGLFRTEEFSDKWSDRCDPDDFGDFAPFVLWLDKITGKDLNRKWIERQMELMDSLRQKSGFYYPFSNGGKKVRQSNWSPIYPQSHLDLILGFNILYKLTKNQRYLQASRRLCDGVMKYAISNSGFVHGAVIPVLHLHLPKLGYLRYKPQVSGVFIEEFTNFYEFTREETYLNAAKRMAEAWLNTKSFKKYGLFPDQVYPITGMEAGTSTLGKENTNMICGLLRLYEVSGDENLKDKILKWLYGLEFFGSGWVYQKVFDRKRGRIIDKEVSIIQNHMVMGALLDVSIILKDKQYLKFAEECANYWLNQEPNWDIDSHADLITMLSRIYDLTGKYKRSIRELAEDMEKFRSGGIFYKLKGGSMGELKYLGGALKGLLSAYTVLNNIKTTDKGTLRLLRRDR